LGGKPTNSLIATIREIATLILRTVPEGMILRTMTRRTTFQTTEEKAIFGIVPE
jgi:hypothetical protein